MFGWSTAEHLSKYERILCRLAGDGVQFLLHPNPLLPAELQIFQQGAKQQTPVLEDSVQLASARQFLQDFTVTSFYLMVILRNPDEIVFIPRKHLTSTAQLPLLCRIPFSRNIKRSFDLEQFSYLLESERVEPRIFAAHFGEIPVILYNDYSGIVFLEKYIDVNAMYVQTKALQNSIGTIFFLTPVDDYRIVHHYSDQNDCAMVFLREFTTEVYTLSKTGQLFPESNWNIQYPSQYLQSAIQLTGRLPTYIDSGNPATSSQTFPSKHGVRWQYFEAGHVIQTGAGVFPLASFELPEVFPLSWLRLFINNIEVSPLTVSTRLSASDNIRLEITPTKHCTNFTLHSQAPVSWATLSNPATFQSILQIPWLSKEQTYVILGRVESTALNAKLPIHIFGEIW